MPHRTAWPRPPIGPHPSTSSASSADKPLSWLLAALRRGRGDNRTHAQERPPPAPVATTPGPSLLYPLEATTTTPPPPSTPSGQNPLSRRLHPIRVVENTETPPPPSSSSRRTTPSLPSTPIRRPNVETPSLPSTPIRRPTVETPSLPSTPSRRPNGMDMLREYDLSSTMAEVFSPPRPPTPAAKRASRSYALPWKMSAKVNPLESAECLCAICLGELGPRCRPGKGEAFQEEPQEELQQRLGCGHVFHASCVQDWLQTQWQKFGEVTCPMCRSPVLPPIAKAEPERSQPSRDIAHMDRGRDRVHRELHPMFGEPAANHYGWAF